YDYVPSEPSRFAKLVAGYAARFGSEFHERAQEAFKCYGANAFLACCAMCGASAESIILAIAIARDGDPAAVLKAYLATGGRGRIEAKITSPLPKQMQEEYKGYTTLLKYWRDNAAHGAASRISDNEAFTSLALLLRFAMFADGRWDELTAKN